MRLNDIAVVAAAAAVGASVGALVMFMFDPDSGRRRRTVARDKVIHYGHEAADALASAARDLRNRAKGVAAETRGTVSNVMSWTGTERRSRPREVASGAPGTGNE
jgi:gas vesicle protein